MDFWYEVIILTFSECFWHIFGCFRKFLEVFGEAWARHPFFFTTPFDFFFRSGWVWGSEAIKGTCVSGVRGDPRGPEQPNFFVWFLSGGPVHKPINQMLKTILHIVNTNVLWIVLGTGSPLGFFLDVDCRHLIFVIAREAAVKSHVLKCWANRSNIHYLFKLHHLDVGTSGPRDVQMTGRLDAQTSRNPDIQTLYDYIWTHTSFALLNIFGC